MGLVGICTPIRLYQRTLDHGATVLLHSWPHFTRGDDQRVCTINGFGTNLGVGTGFGSRYLVCMVVAVEGKVGKRRRRSQV